MEIKYNINPLATQIILNDRDMLLLRTRIALFQATEAYNDVIDGTVDIDTSKPEYRSDECFLESPQVDEIIGTYVEELVGVHSGDCTCVPASCMKCAAETLLGINTLSGLTKHQAHAIESAFVNTRDVNEVIRRLNSIEFDLSAWPEDEREFAMELARTTWIPDRLIALQWLTAYWNRCK